MSFSKCYQNVGEGYLITSQVFSAGIWTFSNCLHHFAQTHLAFTQACFGVSYVCLSTYILHCLILLIFDL